MTDARDADTNAIHQQMLQGLGQSGLPDDDNTRTAQAALATPTQNTGYPNPDNSFDSPASLPHGMSFEDGNESTGAWDRMVNPMGSTADALMAAREATSTKPTVGTPQWHQQRKDNHKEGKSILLARTHQPSQF